MDKIQKWDNLFIYYYAEKLITLHNSTLLACRSSFGDIEIDKIIKFVLLFKIMKRHAIKLQNNIAHYKIPKMKRQLLAILCSLLTPIVFGQTPVIIVYGLGPDLNFDDLSAKAYFHIDTATTNNIWQMGQPQKTFMNAASTIPNALITDTINFYPPDNYSTVNMKLFITQPITDFFFTHKFDTDTMQDGGTIELSIDDSTWHNLLDSFYWSSNNEQVWSGLNFYSNNDTVVSLNNKPGFSGKSNGWISSHFTFYRFKDSSQLDTFRLRFVFASDSINTNKEGWVIDNISIFAYHVGINDYNLADYLIYPNPTSGIIKFSGINKVVRQLSVYNSIGQCLLIFKNPNLDMIDLTNLDSGLYVLSFATDTEIINRKIVLKK